MAGTVDSMRISVVGCAGSGKTTLAMAIAEALRLPRLELDSLYHQRDWVALAADEFRARVSAYCQQPRWVVDGNYSSQGILDIVWRRADTVVWIDPPKHVVLRQVLWRSLRRGIAGTPLWNGNRERLGNLLRSKPQENIVLWAATSFERVRATYSARAKDPVWSHLKFLRLRSAREREAFLASLVRDQEASAGR
jgi:adenylate kinase family enzyme